jgi:hypothetical protein
MGCRVQGKHIPPRVKLNATEVFRPLRPYVSVRFMAQIRADALLVLYLALFQILFLRNTVEDTCNIFSRLIPSLLKNL